MATWLLVASGLEKEASLEEEEHLSPEVAIMAFPSVGTAMAFQAWCFRGCSKDPGSQEGRFRSGCGCPSKF